MCAAKWKLAISVASLCCTWLPTALQLGGRNNSNGPGIIDGYIPPGDAASEPAEAGYMALRRGLRGANGVEDSSIDGYVTLADTLSDTEFFEPTEASQEWLARELGRFRDAEQARRLTTERVDKRAPFLFYIYAGPGVDWVNDCEIDKLPHYFQDWYPDVAVHQKLAQHPWRTHDPDRASLFFVPAYTSWSLIGGCGDHLENMEATAKLLRKSEYFQKSGGSDHMLSAFLFSLNPASLGDMSDLISKMLVANMESDRGALDTANSGFSKSFAIPYGPVSVIRPDLLGDTTPPRDSRSHSLFFMGNADNRPRYRERRIAIRALGDAFPDAVLVDTEEGFRPALAAEGDPRELQTRLPECGEGQYMGCRAEMAAGIYMGLGADSKYTLMIHGDSPSSSRLYDAFQFGSVPIIISQGFRVHATPYPDDVAWKNVTVFVNQDTFVSDPVTAMVKATRKADKLLEEDLLRARLALDWTMSGHCQATSLLSHVGRKFLHVADIPPAWTSPSCSRRF